MRPLLMLALAACARPAAHVHQSMANASADASAYGQEVMDGVARARAATASFKVLDSAVAKGYAANVRACIADSTQGAMGFHHLNRSYVDNKVEMEKPEFLLYERKPDGSYVLNAVEYIVPYRDWPRDSTPPELLGRPMLQSDALQYWYMHMWIWAPNKSGLFADWNRDVHCRLERFSLDGQNTEEADLTGFHRYSCENLMIRFVRVQGVQRKSSSKRSDVIASPTRFYRVGPSDLAS